MFNKKEIKELSIQEDIDISELEVWNDSLQDHFIQYRKRRRMARIEKIFNINEKR
jgi:hypothetical protein